MHTLSVKDLRSKLDNKEISSVELTEFFLNRIESLNPSINALVTVTKEKAINKSNLIKPMVGFSESVNNKVKYNKNFYTALTVHILIEKAQ